MARASALWPGICLTAGAGTPRASSRLAAVWRRSCVPDGRQISACKELLELPVVVAWVDRSADRGGEGARAALPQRPGGDLLLSLLPLVVAQGGEERRGKRKSALAALGLGVGEDQTAAALALQGPAHPQQPGAQVDVIPPQA